MRNNLGNFVALCACVFMGFSASGAALADPTNSAPEIHFPEGYSAVTSYMTPFTYTPYDLSVAVSDPDGDPLTIISISTPLHGTASFSGNYVTYSPSADIPVMDPYDDGDIISVTVSDGHGHTVTFDYTIFVDPPLN